MPTAGDDDSIPACLGVGLHWAELEADGVRACDEFGILVGSIDISLVEVLDV